MISAETSWIAPLLAVLLAAGLTPLLRIWLLRRNRVDLPGARRSHTVPTPRGGGLAVVIALVVALVLVGPTWWPGLIAVLVLAVLGWVEDGHELPARSRLTVQAAVAVLALWLVGTVDTVTVVGYRVELTGLWTPMALVAFVWLVNLHNFMDGSDGLAALQGVWSGLALGALHWQEGAAGPAVFGFSMAAAFAGFLLWNRPPARLFMGDVGSMTLGGGVAMLALAGAASGTVSIWMSLIVSAVFVVDATATLGRRVMRGERWYTAHRQHAYQRLITFGWSHGQVLSLYGVINFGLVGPVVLAAWAFPNFEALLALGLVGLLMGGWWIIQRATTTETQWHE